MKCLKTTFLSYILLAPVFFFGMVPEVSGGLIPGKEIISFTAEQAVSHSYPERQNNLTVFSPFQGSEELIMKDHKKIQFKDFLPREEVFISGKSGSCNKIVVISSHSGVGKSFISLNLACSLAKTGQRVLLLDGNIQHPWLHTLLYPGEDYPATQCSLSEKEALRDAVVSVDNEFYFLGNLRLPGKIQNLQADIYDCRDMWWAISSSYDYMVLDTHTGLNEMNLALFQEADAGVVVSTPDLRTVFDTYTLIKASAPFLNRPALYLVINQVFEKKVSEEARKNLSFAFRHFLESDVKLLGMIPADDSLKFSPHYQKPVWQLSQKMQVMQKIEEMAEVLASSHGRAVPAGIISNG